MIPKTIVGIDPGQSGGIAIWQSKTPVKAIKMPKKEDIKNLSDYFKHLKETNADILVFIEKVQMFMSDSDAENRGKQFRIKVMLANYEQLKALLVFNGLPFVEVHPMSWQSTLGLRRKGLKGQDKKRAHKDYAGNCFPEISTNLWNCDALCLVQFALRKFEDKPEWILERIQNKQGQGLF